MITGEHTVIRSADPDDAAAMRALYATGRLRSSLLDGRMEPIAPNEDELREALASPEAMKGTFFAVEDRTGIVQGFCVLRGASKDAAYGDFNVMLIDEANYEGPISKEIFDFAYARGFELLRLRKIIAHCLDGEEAFRAYLLRCGFVRNGVQRDVFYGHGRWHNLETYSLFAPELRAAS